MYLNFVCYAANKTLYICVSRLIWLHIRANQIHALSLRGLQRGSLEVAGDLQRNQCLRLPEPLCSTHRTGLPPAGRLRGHSLCIPSRQRMREGRQRAQLLPSETPLGSLLEALPNNISLPPLSAAGNCSLCLDIHCCLEYIPVSL